MSFKEWLLMTFFEDEFCSDCRCAPMHHEVSADELTRKITLYCREHKQRCGQIEIPREVRG